MDYAAALTGHNQELGESTWTVLGSPQGMHWHGQPGWGSR
jgi:hypothetical protein